MPAPRSPRTLDAAAYCSFADVGGGFVSVVLALPRVGSLPPLSVSARFGRRAVEVRIENHPDGRTRVCRIEPLYAPVDTERCTCEVAGDTVTLTMAKLSRARWRRKTMGLATDGSGGGSSSSSSDDDGDGDDDDDGAADTNAWPRMLATDDDIQAQRNLLRSVRAARRRHRMRTAFPPPPPPATPPPPPQTPQLLATTTASAQQPPLPQPIDTYTFQDTADAVLVTVPLPHANALDSSAVTLDLRARSFTLTIDDGTNNVRSLSVSPLHDEIDARPTVSFAALRPTGVVIHLAKRVASDGWPRAWNALLLAAEATVLMPRHPPSLSLLASNPARPAPWDARIHTEVTNNVAPRTDADRMRHAWERARINLDEKRDILFAREARTDEWLPDGVSANDVVVLFPDVGVGRAAMERFAKHVHGRRGADHGVDVLLACAPGRDERLGAPDDDVPIVLSDLPAPAGAIAHAIAAYMASSRVAESELALVGFGNGAWLAHDVAVGLAALRQAKVRYVAGSNRAPTLARAASALIAVAAPPPPARACGNEDAADASRAPLLQQPKGGAVLPVRSTELFASNGGEWLERLRDLSEAHRRRHRPPAHRSTRSGDRKPCRIAPPTGTRTRPTLPVPRELQTWSEAADASPCAGGGGLRRLLFVEQVSCMVARPPWACADALERLELSWSLGKGSMDHPDVWRAFKWRRERNARFAEAMADATGLSGEFSVVGERQPPRTRGDEPWCEVHTSWLDEASESGLGAAYGDHPLGLGRAPNADAKRDSAYVPSMTRDAYDEAVAAWEREGGRKAIDVGLTLRVPASWETALGPEGGVSAIGAEGVAWPGGAWDADVTGWTDRENLKCDPMRMDGIDVPLAAPAAALAALEAGGFVGAAKEGVHDAAALSAIAEGDSLVAVGTGLRVVETTRQAHRRLIPSDTERASASVHVLARNIAHDMSAVLTARAAWANASPPPPLACVLTAAAAEDDAWAWPRAHGWARATNKPWKFRFRKFRHGGRGYWASSAARAESVGWEITAALEAAVQCRSYYGGANQFRAF